MNSQLQSVAERVDGLGETMTIATDPVDGSSIVVLGWEAVERILDKLSTLADASTAPEPGVQPANAAEFAALWNTRTPEQREKLVQLLLDQQERAHKCFIEDHEQLKQRQTLGETEVNVLAQYFYEEGGTRRIAMTEKPELVASLQRALARMGRFIPAKPESWDTTQTHESCEHCEAAVEDAITHAKATGSVEATYTHTTPQPRGYGWYSELKHVGTAKRSV